MLERLGGGGVPQDGVLRECVKPVCEIYVKPVREVYT